MLRSHYRIRMASVTWICLLAAAWLACSADNAMATSVYQRFITADCPTGSNFCFGATAAVPAGKVVTLRHVSCIFETLPSPSGLGPVTISKNTLNSIQGVMADFFVPAVIGTNNFQWTYGVNQATLFTVTAGFRIGASASTGATGAIAGLQCLVSGDLI